MAQQRHRAQCIASNELYIYPLSPRIHFKMAARIRNSDWEDDLELKNDLKEQVSRNLWQSEIVDLMKVKYPIWLLEPEDSISPSSSFWDQRHRLLGWFRRS